jgi:arginine utilization protein RocB
LRWQTTEQLEDLLCELVGWHSRTGTQGEIDFPYKLRNKLLELDYFKEHEPFIQLHDADKERNALTALYQSDEAKQTIVLMSHFDTVHTEEFGSFGELAFNPKKLTEELQNRVSKFSEDVQEDVKSGNYLFGRGTMDMKAGLTLHMHILEKASTEKWPINIMLVTVPDEEVNSAGMRAAVKALVNLQEHSLEYTLFLNSEPSFSQKPLDENYYIYSGTIGKIMPSALFYGKETHAGEPLSGITGHYMESYVTKEMEFSEKFKEEAYGEKTPVPVTLKKYDLKKDYSTQTSHHTAALYNVFSMNKNAEEIMDVFKDIVEKAMLECQLDYEEICRRENIDPIGKVQVLEYTQLFSYAEKKFGAEMVQAIKAKIQSDSTLDKREMSIRICDELISSCKELAPVAVVFYTPPYYPAINSSEDPLLQELIQLTQSSLLDEFNVEAKQVHYFNGISDLSYVNYDEHDDGWKSYMTNTPVWGDVYTIPFEEMQQLQAPVLNVGPFGKDAHKLTERLHKESAFVHTPYVLEKIIKKLAENKAETKVM